MDFELSDEQVALRDAARRLLGDRCAPERVREVAAGTIPHDRELWTAIVEQGWLALLVPEEMGGLGLGFVEATVIIEEIGRHVAPVPVLSNLVASWSLARCEASPALVEELVAGDRVACVSADGDLVVDGPLADLRIALDGAVRVAELGSQAPAQPSLDLTRAVCWERDLRAAANEEVGGEDAATEALDGAMTLYAADMLGGSARMLELTVEYAKVREQFGRPIGSFQAVKHRIADMLVDVEGMRSAVYYAAWAVQEGADDRSLAASTAKAWASEASRNVMDSALQVHGGIGFTWEHDLHLFLKRALLSQAALGSASHHRRRVARELQRRVASGESLW